MIQTFGEKAHLTQKPKLFTNKLPISKVRSFYPISNFELFETKQRNPVKLLGNCLTIREATRLPSLLH